MNIFADIEGIEYEIIQPNDLREIAFNDFDINTIPVYCLIKGEKHYFAISKWVSPKRTRSYPYERVYNTLSVSKKITVIPIIKDEGAKGERDFIQWDTVSLMSLLNVYIIFAYYHKAEKNKKRENKITKQQFDNKYIISKINEIGSYYSSALHWNLKEIKECIPTLIEKVKIHYSEIGSKLNVKFHSDSGIDKFQKQFENGVKVFMETSREKAKDAQHREQLTIQPKEVLTTSTKATITIKNYLGGLYYFTIDEVAIQGDTLYLIEGKHSENAIIPNLGDIKDGLLKMILYCNMTNVTVENKKFKPIPILKLTSSNLNGGLNINFTEQQRQQFFDDNNFKSKQINLINTLIVESQKNGFEIIIQGE
ncbi:MAG: hypothetical protein HY738_09865 [Bacteroidia bacterium]|nr:hypothetical protein [Bacteroidia bacterium]